MEKLMTIKEVAEYLQLEEHTIYKMARKGEIPAFKIAGQWRFKKDMIEEWLQKKIKEAPYNPC
jgi:excisionase family DNA binding protein